MLSYVLWVRTYVCPLINFYNNNKNLINNYYLIILGIIILIIICLAPMARDENLLSKQLDANPTTSSGYTINNIIINYII